MSQRVDTPGNAIKLVEKNLYCVRKVQILYFCAIEPNEITQVHALCVSVICIRFPFCNLLGSGGERQDAKLRFDRRRELLGKQNYIITGELLILALWFIEQKVILFR